MIRYLFSNSSVNSGNEARSNDGSESLGEERWGDGEDPKTGPTRPGIAGDRETRKGSATDTFTRSRQGESETKPRQRTQPEAFPAQAERLSEGFEGPEREVFTRDRSTTIEVDTPVYSKAGPGQARAAIKISTVRDLSDHTLDHRLYSSVV